MLQQAVRKHHYRRLQSNLLKFLKLTSLYIYIYFIIFFKQSKLELNIFSRKCSAIDFLSIIKI